MKSILSIVLIFCLISSSISLKCNDQLFSICMGSYYCPPNRPLSVVECPVESRCYSESLYSGSSLNTITGEVSSFFVQEKGCSGGGKKCDSPAICCDTDLCN
ncbi:hypothetical protein BpHYR1_022034 [Brachionus plicatilis]|uniref:Uncharacterized protein n=1 Tax=Brachionus plicatilis TaxID=10195 RepID=A0A3M7SBH1_BRAPC|nr:hypothetical protein BpHYR1_022034 [Brachionus plicatilis]